MLGAFASYPFAMAVLAIDAGTTGVTALVVDESCTILSRGYREFPQHFPQPGWVEHSPDEIWSATLTAVQDALSATEAIPTALGITNQRETVVLWDRKTLQAPRRAIVWQDRRTADIVHELRSRAMERNIRNTTGLGLDPYFSSTKLLWLSRHEPDLWDQVHSGKFAIGTVDSYLIARLTAGATHVTDASNASRTMLFDIHRHLAHGSHGIRVKGDSGRPAHRHQRRDILDRADLVTPVTDGDHDRSWGESLFEAFRINPAISVDGQEGHFKIEKFLQESRRIKHRVMFNARNNQVSPPLQKSSLGQSLNGQVIGFGT